MTPAWERIFGNIRRRRILAEVGAERDRQVYVEGMTTTADDNLTGGHLAAAAAVYARSASQPDALNPDDAVALGWPFHKVWWKPKSPRRDLVRAAALIVAEIERIDRAAERAEEARRRHKVEIAAAKKSHDDIH